MEPRIISITRYGHLVTLLVFSLIVLGLSGHLISGITNGFIVPDYLALDLAVAVITMVVVPVFLAIDFFRRGAFTSMVATELGWTFFLMILWVAAAGDVTAVRAGVSCGLVDIDGFIYNSDAAYQMGCHEVQALIAFSWFNFIILLGWNVTLLTLVIIAHNRGNTSVWTAPVNGTDFFAVRAVKEQPQSQMAYGGMQTQQQQYTGVPVQQQYTGQTQQTYPPTGYSTSPAPAGAQV